MKIIALSLFLLLHLTSFCQLGSISGNAYWKYNESTGNKADAGSYVYLYSADTSIKTRNTVCDLEGNFKFEKVRPGRYLVAIFSKNTNTNGDYNFRQLKSADTRPYFGFNLKEDEKALFDSVEIYQVNMIKKLETKVKYYSPAARKKAKRVEAARKIYEDAIHRLMKKAPVSEKTIFFEFPREIQKKWFLKEFVVTSDENSSIVADFETPYLPVEPVKRMD